MKRSTIATFAMTAAMLLASCGGDNTPASKKYPSTAEEVVAKVASNASIAVVVGSGVSNANQGGNTTLLNGAYLRLATKFSVLVSEDGVNDPFTTDADIAWTLDNSTGWTIKSYDKTHNNYTPTAPEYGSPDSVYALTATITYNGVSDTVNYSITVKAKTTKPTPVDIKDLTKGAAYSVKGKVIGKTTKGLMVSDGTGSVLAFDSALVDVWNVGDYVEVTGGTSSYSNAIQFAYNNSPAVSVVAATGDAPTIPAAVALTADIANSWKTVVDDPSKSVEYTWTTTVGKSGNFFLLPMEGSDTVIEPNYLPSNFTLTEGATITISAIFGGYNTKNSYAGVVVTAIA